MVDRSTSPEQTVMSETVAPLPLKDVGVIGMLKSDVRAIYKYIREVHWKDLLKQSIRRRYWKWYLLVAAAIALTALVSSNHHDIVMFCRPISAKIRSWPGGWMIPIVLLVVLSFPPLVGHEIVGILLGLVYGIWIGFGILAAGTFLGEIFTWIAFKSCCSARAAKFEKQNKLYGSLTQLIREKSFMFVLVLRFSAIPGHITTAVSASAGANFWSYLAAAFLTLPKQFTITYLGNAFDSKNRTTHLVSIAAMLLTVLGTAVAAIYIYYQMRLVIIRNAAQQLPTTTADSSAPTWEDVARVEGDTVMTEGPHARRPWLFSNGSYSNTPGVRTPVRSKSLPGELGEEEMTQWIEDMRYNDTPAIELHGAEKGSEVGTFSFFSPLPSSSHLAVSVDSPVPTRPTPTRTSSRAALLPSELAENGVHRDTVSLDLVRELGQGQVPRGGREIAADADAYAVARGAKRPGYGRSRGDSGAALLGRGDLDA